MASINSVTQANNTGGGYSSKGLSGLASGMNTDEVVEAMTSDIQAKIDKINQEKQTFTWKQEAYREVISSLVGFQDKYFSFASSSNITSSSFFNCKSMVAGGSNAGKISVTGSSSSARSTYNITSISQLATKASFSSGGSKAQKTITTGEMSFADTKSSLVANGTMSIQYGGESYDIKIPADADIKDAQGLADALNKAMGEESLSIGGKLSDKLKFAADADGKMSLSATSATETNSFSIKAGSKNLLGALHMKAGDKGEGGTITGTAPTTEAELIETVPFSLEGRKLTFELNGVSKTIEFTKEDSERVTDINSMQALLQEKVDEKFGKDKLRIALPVAGENKLAFETVKSDGRGGQVIDDSSTLKISSSSVGTLGVDGVFNMPNGEKNRLDTAKSLYDLGFVPSEKDKDGKDVYKMKVNGVEFSFGENDSLAKVISTINNDKEAGVNIAFLSTSGRFNVMSDDSGAQGRVEFEDMGAGDLITGIFGTKAERDAATTAGKDMKMTIRYEGETSDVEINRSSNDVSIDGVNFAATGTFSAYNESGVYEVDKAISFTTKSDTEHAMNTIKSLVDDYNKILESVNKLTTTRPNRNFKPLTETQRKEMSEDEIKIWEDKAKEGILYGDSALNQLGADLRFIFSTPIANAGTAASIGLTSSSSYSDNGKIKIDEKKLKAALENDPDKVKEIFTASAESSPSPQKKKNLDGGLINRMQVTLEAYAKDTGAYKGKLVGIAGIKNNTTTSDNYIERQQKVLDKNLDYLKDLLKSRQDRYQGQFSNLEVYISKMNAQSSWLQSSMGG